MTEQFNTPPLDPDVAPIERASLDDHLPTAYVTQRALGIVIANLTPAAFIFVPFTIMVSVVVHGDVPQWRLLAWVALAALCTAAILVTVVQYRHRVGDDGAIPRSVDRLAFGSHMLVGIMVGVAPLMAYDARPETLVMFAVFPATAVSVGAAITAGRRDLFIALTVPMTLIACIGLALSSDRRMHGLAVMSAFYAVAMLFIHRSLSRSTTQAIELQWRSTGLVTRLDADRAALTALNVRLGASNDQLQHQATHDPLTGLLNRRGALERLDRELAMASTERPVGLMFCDLDRFKAVNDAIGHRGGDRFLSVVADRISRSMETECVPGRIGGDEFIVILPGLDTAATNAVAARLVGVLAQPVHAEGREVPSSVSVGIAAAPADGATSSELLRNANAALYRAKESGRNRVEIFDGDIKRQLLAKVETEESLRRAIDDGEIVPFFQPEIDASNGSIIGAELLARWVRRDGTVTAAADFIAMAIRAGLLQRITEWVVIDARPQIRRLAALGLPDGFRFRINLAPDATERTWRDNPIDRITQGIDPHLLTVDVHEGTVTGDLPAVAASLAAFRARGGRVCLAGFARGLSALSVLRRLPLDEVRIDRVSIDTITAHPHDRAIVRSIIALVREIGLAVTADGVENGTQADALIALGCVRHQGHLYSEALPADAFESFLLARLAERYQEAMGDARVWRTEELGEA